MESYQATVNLIRESSISQSELARRSGLTPTAINRWMNQRVTHIRPSNVEAVASALGKEVVWIGHGRTECRFRDSGFDRESAVTLETSQSLLERLFELQRKFENIEESGHEHPSRIDWHVGFAGWLQMQFEVDYEKHTLSYPIRDAHDGTAYTWKEILGYDENELIGKDYLELLYPVEREQVVARSREVTELSQKMESSILLETDRIFRFRHADGHYEYLFIHSRINLNKKIAKCWCSPLPRIYS